MRDKKRILINDIKIPYRAGSCDDEALRKAEEILTKKTGSVPSNLRIAKKDEAWVKKTLDFHKAALSDTWLLTVDKADHVVFYRKED